MLWFDTPTPTMQCWSALSCSLPSVTVLPDLRTLTRAFTLSVLTLVVNTEYSTGVNAGREKLRWWTGAASVLYRGCILLVQRGGTGGAVSWVGNCRTG